MPSRFTLKTILCSYYDSVSRRAISARNMDNGEAIRKIAQVMESVAAPLFLIHRCACMYMVSVFILINEFVSSIFSRFKVGVSYRCYF